MLEIFGAIGLFIPSTARAAGFALLCSFIALFPANVHAAREKLTIAVSRFLLMGRTGIQIVFVAALAGPRF